MLGDTDYPESPLSRGLSEQLGSHSRLRKGSVFTQQKEWPPTQVCLSKATKSPKIFVSPTDRCK